MDRWLSLYLDVADNAPTTSVTFSLAAVGRETCTELHTKWADDRNFTAGVTDWGWRQFLEHGHVAQLAHEGLLLVTASIRVELIPVGVVIVITGMAMREATIRTATLTSYSVAMDDDTQVQLTTKEFCAAPVRLRDNVMIQDGFYSGMVGKLVSIDRGCGKVETKANGTDVSHLMVPVKRLWRYAGW